MQEKKKNKWYSPIRNFKKFKKEYKNFIVFIKNGNIYITYDADAKILMYLFNNFKNDDIFIISKDSFGNVLKLNYNIGLNVVLAGSKHTKEYYSDKENKYIKLRAKAKQYYRGLKNK